MYAAVAFLENNTIASGLKGCAFRSLTNGDGPLETNVIFARRLKEPGILQHVELTSDHNDWVRDAVNTQCQSSSVNRQTRLLVLLQLLAKQP